MPESRGNDSPGFFQFGGCQLIWVIDLANEQNCVGIGVADDEEEGAVDVKFFWWWWIKHRAGSHR